MVRGHDGGQLTRDDRTATVQISVAKLKTPIGAVQVIASGDSVLFVGLPGRHEPRPQGRWLRARVQRHPQTLALRAALTELHEYFAGKRRRFDVPIDPAGTEFQERVWQAVGAIPFGETASYGEIAAQLGGVHLARAVGAAVGANPIPIIIPCHRVLGSDGSLTGYGGGLRMKVWLLHHEGVLLA
jgi:methylated-DNA-[protein]-cysteine S-methyltransferase